MCGRYTLASDPKKVRDLLPLFDVPEFEPRLNISPTQDVAVARIVPYAQRAVNMLRWGLIPSWADEPKIGARMINARSETAASKPSFRAAWRKRRCLIPADGFYEWKKIEGQKKKQPYWIHRADREVFAFAGLWEHWKRDGEVIESCTILTTAANDRLKELHERMPVILDPADFERWLDPDNQKGDGLQELMRSYPAEKMDFFAVESVMDLTPLK